MRVRSRILAAAGAVVLAATSLTTTAVADMPTPELPMVYCPDKPAVEAILGEALYSANFTRASCSYPMIDGKEFNFSFSLSESAGDLARLRASAEADGKTVVDVPELGVGAFSANNGLELRWDNGMAVGQLYALSVPEGRSDVAVRLAKVFAAAVGDPPAITVPAKVFTLTCPTAKQVTRTMGRTVKLAPTDGYPCSFKDGDKWITFSTVPVYGSIFEYRDRVRRDLSTEPPMNTAFMYFAGLTPGAFATADMSPINLRWQLQEGVIAQLYALENDSVLIRLAELLKSVQGGQGKPGLPSTGD